MISTFYELNRTLSLPQSKEPVSGKWNDWTQATFEGDKERKNKFLRLMGGGKSGSTGEKKLFGGLASKAGASSGGVPSAIDSQVNKKIQDDLERQFQAGRQFSRQKQRGKGIGLGFSS